jgi:YVTN family beta-propeller protein
MRSLWIMTGAATALALLSHNAWAFTAYVSNEKGNTVSVIDLDNMEVTATVEVGERPRGITMSKDGKHVYICTSDADHIEVLDTDTLKVLNTLPSGPDPELFTLARRQDALRRQ